jgi:hypothetical protein
LHLTNHGTVLIVGLVDVAGHLLNALYRQRRWRFGHLLLQLRDAVLKAFFSVTDGVNRLAWMRVYFF